VADPHFKAREAIIRLAHPELGEFPMHGVFPKLSDTPGSVRSLGPELGQHNKEIYEGILGIAADKLSAMNSAGII
jgi:formyl-CoA transferase